MIYGGVKLLRKSFLFGKELSLNISRPVKLRAETHTSWNYAVALGEYSFPLFNILLIKFLVWN